jgi:hypothetical protein
MNNPIARRRELCQEIVERFNLLDIAEQEAIEASYSTSLTIARLVVRELVDARLYAEARLRSLYDTVSCGMVSRADVIGVDR